MKRNFYHGTSADNLESILQNGLSCDEIKLWNCSGDEIYLWGAMEVGKEWDCETDEESEERAFRMASESGQIACIASKDCRIVVLRIELDDSEIMPDTSHENMEGRGAVCINRTIELSEIKDIKVSNDLSMLKGYFIAMMADNEFFDVELSRLERRIGEAFKNAEIYPEDIDELIEWDNVNIPAIA